MCLMMKRTTQAEMNVGIWRTSKANVVSFGIRLCPVICGISSANSHVRTQRRLRFSFEAPGLSMMREQLLLLKLHFIIQGAHLLNQNSFARCFFRHL